MLNVKKKPFKLLKKLLKSFSMLRSDHAVFLVETKGMDSSVI